MAKAKPRGPAAMSARQKGFAVAALAAMLAPALIVGTKLVDWVNVAKQTDIAVALTPADVWGALKRDPSELGAGGRLPLSDELSAALLSDLEDGVIDDPLDNGLVDNFPGDYGIPGVVLEAYLRAEDKMAEMVPGCKLDWALLAGIGKVESNHANNGRVNSIGDATPKILGPVLKGGPGIEPIRDTDGGRLDGDTTWDRAVGPMQFIPSTWAGFGADGNDDGNVNPNNVYDAALAAGRYLCAGGGDMTKQTDRAKAVWRYNHSNDYVKLVLKWAKTYGDNVNTLPNLPDNGNNVKNPTPTPPNPGNPEPNPGPSNPPSSNPPSSTPPSSNPCITTPPSSTSPSSSTPSKPPNFSTPQCPPSSTPPSSNPPSSNPSSNPPASSASTPPAGTTSSNTPKTTTSATERSTTTSSTTTTTTTSAPTRGSSGPVTSATT